MKSAIFIKQIVLVSILLTFSACRNQTYQVRQRVNLSGLWQFSTDTADIGIRQKWYSKDLPDVIKLPGTTDLNKKGVLNHDTTTGHLNRVYRYEGPAWYRKKVVIPPEFQDRHVVLIMERTKSSRVWIDDQYIGESALLQSPQHYDVSGFLSPGEHTIAIRVDNNLKLTPYGNVHIYTDETQTNWNGITGNILLEASSRTYISDLRVFPDITGKMIRVEMAVVNGMNAREMDAELRITRFADGVKKRLGPLRKTIPCDSVVRIEYLLGDDMALWDDYRQPLYKLTAVIGNDSFTDSKTVPFGMRQFKAEGRQFTINGRTTFLRGKHDACVFPLTGHPPMEPAGWKHVFKIARSYGINHYRFHSYCPPEAAFEAADELGIFLQPELPFWGGLESDTLAAMLKDEGFAMLKSYANHPSFVMFCPGNEIWSGHDRVAEIIAALRERDPRPLYTMGANNNIGYAGPRPCSDFYIAARTPYEKDTILTHTRLTQAFCDSRDGGILNTQEPSSAINFDYPVAHIDVPLISHEIGQYQIYPDYREIKKYTGVLRAWNLEIFRSRLAQAGMLDQVMDFHRASGVWAARCYRAEMEAALRTAHLAGFQLLDLQDYPGQGTALVGILDAFMDSKRVIRRDEWLQSCNDVVLLLEFPRYCWTHGDTFRAGVKVANYSNRTISDDLEWEISGSRGKIHKKGTISNLNIAAGGLAGIGRIEMPLHAPDHAEKLTIDLRLKKTAYRNTYHAWIYPAPGKNISHEGIIIAEELDTEIMSILEEGGKVLLFPAAESIRNKSVGGLFPPDFWNYGMFRGISEWLGKPVSPGTLGIVTDPGHPVFRDFPTGFHTDWQWFSIIKASRPLILNRTPHDYRPIVQVIDNPERNHKLGLVFEFACGKGGLLVCMSRLTDILNEPEACQLFRSLIRYMQSGDFNPVYSADRKLLEELLSFKMPILSNGIPSTGNAG